MQNNVAKRTCLALLCSLLLCTVLFVLIFLPIEDRNAQAVPSISEPTSQVYDEQDGVKYIGTGFTVSEYSAAVKRGETATVTVCAERGTKINISAYYKSGKSQADAFTAKTVTADSVSFTWTVPRTSTSESIRIVLRSADTYATLLITLI